MKLLRRGWNMDERPLCTVHLLVARPVAVLQDDGWELFWECPADMERLEDIEWPFVDESASAVDFIRLGFEL